MIKSTQNKQTFLMCFLSVMLLSGCASKGDYHRVDYKNLEWKPHIEEGKIESYDVDIGMTLNTLNGRVSSELYVVPVANYRIPASQVGDKIGVIKRTEIRPPYGDVLCVFSWALAPIAIFFDNIRSKCFFRTRSTYENEVIEYSVETGKTKYISKSKAFFEDGYVQARFFENGELLYQTELVGFEKGDSDREFKFDMTDELDINKIIRSSNIKDIDIEVQFVSDYFNNTYRAKLAAETIEREALIALDIRYIGQTKLMVLGDYLLANHILNYAYNTECRDALVKPKGFNKTLSEVKAYLSEAEAGLLGYYLSSDSDSSSWSQKSMRAETTFETALEELKGESSRSLACGYAILGFSDFIQNSKDDWEKFKYR
jgi:hypothetical protein